MEFALSTEQEALCDLAAQIFGDSSAAGTAGAAKGAHGEGPDRDLWRKLGEAHLLGLAVPAEYGGSGLGLFELCLLLEQQGRCLAPVPVLSCAVAAMAIARYGSDEQRSRWLLEIAAGRQMIALALQDPVSSDVRQPGTRAQRGGDRWLLSGGKAYVTNADTAGLLVVPARIAADRTGVFLLPRETPGAVLERQQSVHGEALFTLRLDEAAVANEQLLGGAEDGAGALAAMEHWSLTCLAALQLGICEEALRRTADFTSQRQQFGRPIATFQGVALRAADSYIAVEALRSTMWQAAWRIDSGRDAERETLVAKWWAARVGHEVTHSAQHLHGGIGADVSYPIHRYFLWAKHVSLSLGGEALQLQRLGDVIRDRALAAASM